MKKNIVLSAVVVALLGSVSAISADDALSTMFKDGKASGQIREFSIARYTKWNEGTGSLVDADNISHALGGKLKFETADYKGLSFGTALYTTNRIGGESDTSTDKTKGPNNTVLNADADGYSILGEAYLKYTYGKTTFTAGRQKINNPLMGADDVRMIPNLYTSYNLTNTSLDGVKFNLNHTTEMANGTFSNAYGAGGSIIGATAGYTAVSSFRPGDFHNFGDYAVGEETAGITTLGVTYTGVKGLKIQLWDYISHDISNTIYGDVSYKMKTGSISPFVAAQFIKQSDAGKKLLKNAAFSTNGKLQGMYYGLKAGLSVSGFTTYLAYSSTSANSDSDLVNEGSATNAIVLMSGGYPIYTQGMVTRHMTFAGSKAMKFVLAYSFKKMGPDLKVVGYYIKTDLDKNNGYYNNTVKVIDSTTEKGFDIIYNTSFAKNLQLRLRGNYVTDWSDKTTGETRDWSEYRFIANYTF
ncbi:OprD family outer membrane porin [Sulfurimonas sp.]|uniref:OprD family outer membrane porin n=1 Tax=Sulfurimonas sp. TaxID=2022749 RepID=UPI002AB205B7|nr:OprD family outer membrane porin [Sulfurimonas sp.]